MATIRVRSTDGNDADDGTTWALAKATLTGAAAIDSAGDTIVVSSVHAESTAAALNFGWAGVAASPTRILSVDDSADPPTALLPGAAVTTTGANNIDLASSINAYYYVDGMYFNCGTGASNADIRINGAAVLDRCRLYLVNTGSGSIISIIGTTTDIRRTLFRFANAGQGISVGASGLPRTVVGGGIAAGGTNITTLLNALAAGANIVFDGFDLSNQAGTINISNTSAQRIVVRMKSSLLPASWSGALNVATPGPGAMFEMFSCWSGATEIIWRRKAQFGEGRDETTLVRTGGGKHRGVGVSLKCDTNADAEYPHQPFDTLQFVAQVTAAQVGSPVTATVEILHDSVTALTDADIWLTVVGPEDEVNSDQLVDVFATPAAQATSSATWTTTGMANPNTQKLTVTWTPAKAGAVLGTVSIAAASKTVYVDNMMTVAA